MIRIAPKGLARVFYSDNGSTAVEIALKMAVQYWQQQHPEAGPKKTFLHLKLAYHGDTIGAVSVGNIELFHARFKPLLFPTVDVEPPHCYRCPLKLTYPSCGMACMEPIEDIVKRRHRDLAGVIIEPLMQAAAGMIPQPPGYLKRIRELCTEFKVLLIVDEVATGFGRTGKMFACEHEGVTPDLMAISKGLTGGYMPLAATLTTDEIYQGFLGSYDEFKTFFHGHSFTGNPLGCSVALANLMVFRQEKTLAQLASKIKLFRRLLAPLAAIPQVGDIRQRGLMAGVELVLDKRGKTPYPLSVKAGHLIAAIVRTKTLILRPIANVLVLIPPLAISKDELKKTVEILKQSIETLQRDASPIHGTSNHR